MLGKPFWYTYLNLLCLSVWQSFQVHVHLHILKTAKDFIWKILGTGCGTSWSRKYNVPATCIRRSAKPAWEETWVGCNICEDLSGICTQIINMVDVSLWLWEKHEACLIASNWLNPRYIACHICRDIFSKCVNLIHFASVLINLRG